MRGISSRKGVDLLIVLAVVLAATPVTVTLWAPSARADTYVDGPISVNTTWAAADSPFIVVDSVTVEAGATLTVEPGVVVRANADRAINVVGQLVAIGNPTVTLLFTVNATAPPAQRWSGIHAYGGGRVQIENATIEFAGRGVYLDYSPFGTYGDRSEVKNSLLRHNLEGVFAFYSKVLLEGNSFVDNGEGVTLQSMAEAFVLRNAFENQANNSILVYNTPNMSAGGLRIEGNTIVRSVMGIQVTGAYQEFFIVGNDISLQGEAGIWITSSRYGRVEGNRIHDNFGTMGGAGTGLAVASSPGDPLVGDGTRVRCNEFLSNGVGESVSGSSGVLTHGNNFLNNLLHAADDSASANAWDNGTSGNYWSNYTGVDSDGDGIGDTPYAIDADTFDEKPLIRPADLTAECPAAGTSERSPTANAGGPYSGGKNRGISFDGTGSSDPDGTIVAYAWDFGDGGSASTATATHVYGAAGVYTVTLLVTDNDGLTDVDTTTATIEDLAPLPPEMLGCRLTGGTFQHVVLEWALSGDDGGLDNDVTGYDVYYGTTYDATGASYALLGSVPAGSTTFTHIGGGSGGTVYFYQVYAHENTGRLTAAADQCAKFARSLSAGSQLVSVPVELGDWSVASVFQTISWSRARTFVNPAGQGKNWLSNDNQKPWADLTTLSRTMAVWVKVDADGFWRVAGLVPHSTEIPLEVGWNFIGYPSFTAKTVGQVLAGIEYQTIEGYANDPPFNLHRLSAADMMSAGNGYWVHVSQGALLVFTN